MCGVLIRRAQSGVSPKSNIERIVVGGIIQVKPVVGVRAPARAALRAPHGGIPRRLVGSPLREGDSS
jgi:hypothetical protein